MKITLILGKISSVLPVVLVFLGVLPVKATSLDLGKEDGMDTSKATVGVSQKILDFRKARNLSLTEQDWKEIASFLDNDPEQLLEKCQKAASEDKSVPTPIFTVLARNIQSSKKYWDASSKPYTLVAKLFLEGVRLTSSPDAVNGLVSMIRNGEGIQRDTESLTFARSIEE
jgi:hypothetical protein